MTKATTVINEVAANKYLVSIRSPSPFTVHLRLAQDNGLGNPCERPTLTHSGRPENWDFSYRWTPKQPIPLWFRQVVVTESGKHDDAMVVSTEPSWDGPRKWKGRFGKTKSDAFVSRGRGTVKWTAPHFPSL